MTLYSEEIINGIETTLKDNMLATIAEADAAAGDNLTLDNIAEYQKAWVQILNRNKYPAIGIQPAPGNYEPSGQGQTLDGESEYDIICAVQDADSERLQKKMLRYKEIIREIIQRNPTLGGACLYAYPSADDYAPAASGLAIAIVTITALAEIR